ncbi:MAG: hypothetical protein H7838_01075 [Magnetococcus sp. DMHC-8]
MKNPLRQIFSPGWPVLWSAAVALMVVWMPRSVLAVDPPSEKELSTMGQGFGKFVGSFMRQMQSEEEKKGVVPEERRAVDRVAPGHGEWPTRRDREEDRAVRPGPAPANSERRSLPYRLYDPWGSARWGDPVFGFDPWERNNSWVDHDWNLRKWQYGWTYGGTHPYSGGHPYGGGHPYYGGGLYPGGEGWRPVPPGGDRYRDEWEREGYDQRSGEAFGYRPYAPSPWSGAPSVSQERGAWTGQHR